MLSAVRLDLSDFAAVRECEIAGASLLASKKSERLKRDAHSYSFCQFQSRKDFAFA